MNYKIFEKFYAHAEFDEIKIIGKDIEKQGKPYHIMGMSLKDRKAFLYVLERGECLENMTTQQERTRREQLKNSMESHRNRSFFMGIREFRCKDKVLEVGGINSGHCANGEYLEAHILFARMLQAGWKVSESSPFYELPWKELVITKMELRDEMDILPDWEDDMQVMSDSMPEEYAIEVPVILTVGQQKEIAFETADGSRAVCYINGVYLVDVWAEQAEKFGDEAYRERMLQHMTEDDFKQMQNRFFEALSYACPQGMCFPVIEYECTKDIGLNFYAGEYLDNAESPKEGSATAIFMMVKPDVKIGSHGLKMRACMVQTPMESGAQFIDAELFSYSETIKKIVSAL